jgi:hypothetical protein
MVLKRKRSDSEISVSSGSFLSSPPPQNAMETSSLPPSISPFLREINPPHLSSRTRKRFRDNRPSEAKIHGKPSATDDSSDFLADFVTEHTLSMLYSAQNNQQPSHAPPPIAHAPLLTTNAVQQTSLHSFWSLPSRTSSCASSDAGASSLSLAVICQAANCEDCETLLVSEDGDAMDIDMDIDEQGTALDYACSKCQKLVCHRCAISNLGSYRQCLMCAGKRTWVGGIGWMDQN